MILNSTLPSRNGVINSSHSSSTRNTSSGVIFNDLNSGPYLRLPSLESVVRRHPILHFNSYRDPLFYAIHIPRRTALAVGSEGSFFCGDDTAVVSTCARTPTMCTRATSTNENKLAEHILI